MLRRLFAVDANAIILSDATIKTLRRRLYTPHIATYVCFYADVLYMALLMTDGARRENTSHYGYEMPREGGLKTLRHTSPQ